MSGDDPDEGTSDDERHELDVYRGETGELDPEPLTSSPDADADSPDDSDDAEFGAGDDADTAVDDAEFPDFDSFEDFDSFAEFFAATDEGGLGDLQEESTEALQETILDEVVAFFETGDADAFADAPDEAFLREHWFDFGYLEQYVPVDHYWVNEPYAYVAIVYDVPEREYRYHVVEPTLDSFEQYVRQDLVTLLRNSLMHLDVEEAVEDREAAFTERAKAIIADHAATVDDGTLQKVLYYLLRDFVNYGKIDGIMRDGAVEDVSCDGEEVPIYVYHREYRDLQTNLSFSQRRLNSFVVRLAQQAGKSLTVSDPLVDASLPDGSRVQLTLGPDVATRGSNFTIRKFADVPYTPIDLLQWGTFGLDQMVYFWLAIEHNKSLIFAGGTGSGKTTSMNAISFFIPPHAKVVTIEDTREIDLPHQNWVQSVTRSSASGEGRGEVTTYDLLQAALRQRPEYILVGEIRTEQRVAMTFFQAMGTGHTAYTTVHADSVETVLTRLQNPPLSISASMLGDLDIVSIQRQSYVDDHRIRRNQAVAEFDAGPTGSDQVETNHVFRWNAANDDHEWVGDSDVLAEVADERGWSDAELAQELENRRAVLQYLLDEGITGYGEVAATIQMYAKDPEFLLEEITEERLDATAIPTYDEATPGQTAHEAAADADQRVAERDSPMEVPDGDVSLSELSTELATFRPDVPNRLDDTDLDLDDAEDDQ